MHGRHHLHQVRPVTILAVLVRRGKERDQINPNGACVSKRKLKVIVPRRFHVPRRERKFIALPLRRQARHRSGRQSFTRLVVDDRDAHWSDVGCAGSGVERSVVRGCRVNGYAPVALVLHSGLVCSVGLRNLDPQTVRQGRARSFFLVKRHRGRRISPMHDVPVADTPVAVILKCAVTHHLRIQAAVVRVVDLFRHQTVDRWADCVQWSVQLDLQRRRWLLCGACSR
jgi:hypothetical protein